MKFTLKDVIQRYCIALFFTVIATWLRQTMEPAVGDRVPFGTYLLSVLLTAWLAGTGPALASLVFGILAAAHFIMPPSDSVLPANPGDMLALSVYGIVGAVAISLFDRSSRQHEMTRGQLQKIESLSTELKLADRRKDEFLALLSHELRNPMAPIRSGVLLLQRTDLNESRQRTILATMSRQLDQLIRIVDDLLDVSRFVHGRIELDCEPVDFGELVETAVEQAQSAIESRHHELQVVVPSQPVIIHGDRIRIVQIVTNLLTNAAKYTPKEGTIHVLLNSDREHATLQVVDNGIGIIDEIRPYIFELFARSHAAIRRDQSGLGLGLPIAKQFAEMHNGRLEAFSEGAGRGSRFTLTLPVERKRPLNTIEVMNVEKPVALPDRDAFLENTTGTRVLVIDDNRDAAETMSTLLSLYKFAVCTAHDGPDALRRVQKFHPKIILLDIGLPGMDGYEVARRLRSDDAYSDVLIIAVTGWGGEADIEKSKSAGIDHHLVKPIDPQQLFSLMQNEPLGRVGV